MNLQHTFSLTPWSTHTFPLTTWSTTNKEEKKKKNKKRMQSMIQTPLAIPWSKKGIDRTIPLQVVPPRPANYTPPVRRDRISNRSCRVVNYIVLTQLIPTLKPEGIFQEYRFYNKGNTPLSPKHRFIFYRGQEHEFHDYCYQYLCRLIHIHKDLIAFMNPPLSEFVYSDDGSLTVQFKDNDEFYFQMCFCFMDNRVCMELQFMSKDTCIFAKQLNPEQEYKSQLPEIFEFIESINPHFC